MRDKVDLYINSYQPSGRYVLSWNIQMASKEKISEKALELFRKRGYDNTPMSHVAKALRLSKGGLYHHFTSKEDLLFHVIYNRMQEEFVPIIEESKRISDPEERISYFLRNFTRLMARTDSARVIVGDARRLKPNHLRKVNAIWRKTFDLLRDAISEMQAAGNGKKLNQTFMAFGVIGMVSWTMHWFDYSRNESWEELADTFIETFFRGFSKSHE